MTWYRMAGPLRSLELGDHRDRVAAHAIPGQRQPATIKTKFLAMLSNVLGRRIVLLDRHRKICFGRGRVVHKYKRGMSRVHQIAQQSVMGVLAAQDPTFAMDVRYDR